MGRRSRDEVAALVVAACAERSLPCRQIGPWSYEVTLPGTRKLATACQLVVGDHALRLAGFVMRAPEENREQLWAWLLRRNAGLYAVAYAIDAAGDVYLTGRVGLAAVTDDELDRLFGVIVDELDGAFDPMLEIGFRSAIIREWQWRISRGEPVSNLAAFRHLMAPPDRPDGPDGPAAG